MEALVHGLHGNHAAMTTVWMGRAPAYVAPGPVTALPHDAEARTARAPPLKSPTAQGRETLTKTY